MNTIILLACVMTFALFFWMNISSSQLQRQRLVLICIGLIVLLVLGYYLEILNADADIIFFSTSVLWAQIFAYLFNLRRKVIYKSKIHWGFSSYFWLVLACIIILSMMWATTLPNRIYVDSGKPVLDERYYHYVFRQLLLLIPVLLLTLSFRFQQNTIIYQDGVYQNGLFWNWSEIKDYKWIGSILDDGIDISSFRHEQLIVELIFTTGKTLFWKEKQIQVIIPYDDSKSLSKFLEQNIREK